MPNKYIILKANNTIITFDMNLFAFVSELPSVEDIRASQAEKQITNKKIDEEFFARMYDTMMECAIFRAIEELENSPRSHCAVLNLKANEPMIGYFSSTYFNNIHYGGKPVQGPNGLEWTNRLLEPLFVGRFKKLQTSLLERGYYLLDISDPNKGKNFIIKLYLHKPSWYDQFEPLWHGLNKI